MNWASISFITIRQLFGTVWWCCVRVGCVLRILDKTRHKLVFDFDIETDKIWLKTCPFKQVWLASYRLKPYIRYEKNIRIYLFRLKIFFDQDKKYWTKIALSQFWISVRTSAERKGIQNRTMILYVGTTNDVDS